MYRKEAHHNYRRDNLTGSKTIFAQASAFQEIEKSALDEREDLEREDLKSKVAVANLSLLIEFTNSRTTHKPTEATSFPLIPGWKLTRTFVYVLLGRCLCINREPCPPKSRQAISYNHTLRLIARFARPAAPLIFIYYPYSGASYSYWSPTAAKFLLVLEQSRRETLASTVWMLQCLRVCLAMTTSPEVDFKCR